MAPFENQLQTGPSYIYEDSRIYIYMGTLIIWYPHIYMGNLIYMYRQPHSYMGTIIYTLRVVVYVNECGH